MKEERGKLMELMDERVEGWPGMEENERVTLAMGKACTDQAVGRAMERLWWKRFIVNGSHPSTRSMTLTMWTDY